MMESVLKHDAITSGSSEMPLDHEFKHIEAYIKALSPNGSLTLFSTTDISSLLKITGFENINRVGDAITCSKPSYELGQKIKLGGNKSWLNKTDDELINDESLITPDDFIKPVILSEQGIVQKKKACKDCSCGLKEEEDAAEVSPLKLDILSDVIQVQAKKLPKSSCGSVSYPFLIQN